ncbi:unnamed protein product [Angiostrongylus costaricensis]|uniref:RNA helicase n=1 Tax=Angiostrongylus costaricensis TaxID=334426 RepID=A0A0R3PR93_ANGCS|nr:unnamed protein product [Angiostrongylus costaricensis]
MKAFSDFDIDERLLKSIGIIGWESPTQVQESLFSLALEDKNVIARARTGSGKTGAYLIPIINKVIGFISSDSKFFGGPTALFIAPTKELCIQINDLLVKLLEPLPFLQSLNLSDLAMEERSVWENVSRRFLKYWGLYRLDVPDFISIKKSLPSKYQCIMTSATVTDDMSPLKTLFMTGPVFTIKLKEGDLPNVDQLAQYQITCLNDHERFTILVAMFKLRLIVGKTIIFVNDTNRCYMTSLVLRAFGLKSCVLNSSMPANSRFHVINQYNNGAFDIIIASDAVDAFGDDSVQSRELYLGKYCFFCSWLLFCEIIYEYFQSSRKDKESGVSRGIDFHQVGNVVNLDFPTSTDIYIHRVGRTARGRNKGTALSLCTPEERVYLDEVQEDINGQMGRKVIVPYEIRIKELDSFVLRVKEVLSKCGKSTIKAARIQEIKLEVSATSYVYGFTEKMCGIEDFFGKSCTFIYEVTLSPVTNPNVPNAFGWLLRGIRWYDEYPVIFAVFGVIIQEVNLLMSWTFFTFSL